MKHRFIQRFLAVTMVLLLTTAGYTTVFAEAAHKTARPRCGRSTTPRTRT